MSRHITYMMVVSAMKKKIGKGVKECCFVLLVYLTILNRVIREEY